MHQVWMFHYTSWKDFGCPEEVTSLLTFIEVVRIYHDNEENTKLEKINIDEDDPPVIVHCR